MRHLILAAPLALGLVSAPALAAGKTPPPEYAAYVAAVRKADALQDPLQRCLAYPDLPGNTWAAGAAKARCTTFLTPAIFTLDTLESALAQPDGAKAVDAKFRAVLDAQQRDQRDQIFTALSIFKSSARADDAERIARSWRKASPDSPFAMTALGHVLAGRGWNARGEKYIRDTPEEDVRRMEAYFADALVQYADALKAEPKLLPACEGAMAIGRQSSEALEMVATKKCMDADPVSFYVVEEMLQAAEPRWGGSLAQMRNVAAFAQAHVQDNPVLAMLTVDHIGYEADRADDDARNIAELEPATLLAPQAGYLRKVGGAYLRKNDDWKAFVYLSQALRFMPDYAQESRYRAFALYRLGEPAWARADAERALALDPDNAYTHRVLADILRDTVGGAAARPHYELAMREPRLRENAFIESCATLVNAKDKEAAACVDKLLKEYPDNGEAWHLQLMVLGPTGPGAAEAMKRFLATQDPEHWPSHKRVAEQVKPMLAALEGGNDFDARAARATMLERSPEGRDFLGRYIPAVQAALTQAIQACFTPGAKEKFTAVMDVLADGSIGNVAVSPVNARTSCYAGRAAKIKGPSPPDSFAGKGFPMAIQTTLR